MCVWAGLFVMAGPAVWLRCPWAAASPLFTFALIRFMSGGCASAACSISAFAAAAVPRWALMLVLLLRWAHKALPPGAAPCRLL